MGRLKLYIGIFCMALAAPMAYFVHQAKMGLEQEERGALRFFAESILNYMEDDLARITAQEEGRAVDDYAPAAGVKGSSFQTIAPVPEQPWIIGYFQNNPDGSFVTPHAGQSDVVRRISSANQAFNRLRRESPELRETGALALLTEKPLAKLEAADAAKALSAPEPVLAQKAPEEKKDAKPEGFVEKYLSSLTMRKSTSQLGRKEKRVEEITQEQAANVIQEDRNPARDLDYSDADQEQGAPGGSVSRDSFWSAENQQVQSLDSIHLQDENERGAPAPALPSSASAPQVLGAAVSEDAPAREINAHVLEESLVKPAREETAQFPPKPEAATLRVEVDPLQSMVLGPDQVLLFRRIVIDNKVYNQGVAIRTKEFMSHLLEVYFAHQPMAQYARLTLSAAGKEASETVSSGVGGNDLKFHIGRTFPRPFSFLSAQLDCYGVPRSAGRRTLAIMQGVLGFVMLAGLFAIYRSAAAVLEYSRRRSQFVSSVTHELKTPLTNIRMYVEMLEMGIARDTEREQEYLKVLGAESSRLSRLITNVLEFAKLENRNSRPQLQNGDLSEVIAELRQVMGDRLRSEGFTLDAPDKADQELAYDRDSMVQVLVNLVENSIKFCREAQNKTITLSIEQDGRQTRISVSDHGPGIPQKALKRVFEDFFRVEDALVRATRGTGIGLALVRRFAQSMGGKVTAENNPGSGCTITIALPR